MLVENADTRLIVIDPVSGYLGNADSHRNSDIRGLLAPLADLAGRHRVAIVTVTHLAKTGGVKAVHRPMGSLAFAAAARAVWIITKDLDDPRRRLFLPAKLNLAHDPDGLAYRIEDARVCWELQPIRLHADDGFAAEAVAQARPSNREAERREATGWLRERLADGPVLTSQVVTDAKEHGFSERTLRRAFKEMGGCSKKETDGQWHWSLSSGQQVCQTPP